MERGDILTLVAGLVVVVVIALVMNPPSLESGPAPVTPAPVVTTPLSPSAYHQQNPVRTTTPVVPTMVTIRPDDPPYQIFYTSQPFSFPRYKLPDNMVTFGASDIPLRTEAMVPFAYVEDTRGGLTQKFSVPYPVWVINTTVVANRTPQYGNYKMALCYASNGTIIEGDEILNRGTSYRIVQTSNTDLYFIISTAYIDRYIISLETPRSYYDAYRP